MVKWTIVFLLALLVIWMLPIWPVSENWMRNRGREELESHIRDEGLRTMSSVRLCDLLHIDNEPDISMHFICRVDLREGTLHFDVAFTSTGEIEYQDIEIGD